MMIRQLVAGGYLELDIAGYGGLRIHARGEELLRGRKSFRYRPTVARKERCRERVTARTVVPETDHS